MLQFIRIFCGCVFLFMGIMRLFRHSFFLSKRMFAALEENGTMEKFCVHSGLIWILLGVLFLLSAFPALTEQCPALFWVIGFADIGYAVWLKANYA